MRRGLPTTLTVAITLTFAASAGAATIQVNTTADTYADGTSTCSVREAVQSANTNTDFDGCVRSGPKAKDTILLEGGEIYARTRAGIDDSNLNGDLDIAKNTVIKVEGAGKATIDANDHDRVIDVLADGRLTAARLILEDGILDGAQPLWVVGGGILNQGMLTLKNSVVQDNQVTTNQGCPCGGGVGSVGGTTTLRRVVVQGNDAIVNLGGGIAHLFGDLKISDSWITDNYANSGAGLYLGGNEGDTIEIAKTTIEENFAVLQAGSRGGGIWLSSSGASRKLKNVTISGNEATSSGGGIYLFSGVLNANGVTITENVADSDDTGTGDGGGLDAGASLKLRNSIIAGNRDLGGEAPDCETTGGSPDAVGHNLIGMGGGCPEFGSNVVVTNPKLFPIGDNGGHTRTHALRSTSQAIGQAGNSAPLRDQRGVKRDAHPDIGAFERR